MAWTQDDLDKLGAAIAKGATEVAYKGNRVQYRSLDEMLKLKQQMEAEVKGTPATTTRVTTFSRGF